MLPAVATFDFNSPDETDARAREAANQWVPQRAGKSFHVRMRLHGFKGRLSSHEEEKSLAEFLLERLQESGQPNRIILHDSDFVLVVVTVDQRAGVSLWSRDDGNRYPFLRLAQE